ncbi:MAG: hypothetical protein ACTHU0_05205 [Kofleriaceae bacterium]
MVRILVLLVLSSCKDDPEERGLTDLQLRVRSYCDWLVFELEGATRDYKKFVAAGADERVLAQSLWSIGRSYEARSFKVLDLSRRFLFCAVVRNPMHAGAGDLVESLVRSDDPRSRLPSHEETIRALEALTERSKQMVAVPLIE